MAKTKRSGGTALIPTTSSKENWKCPACQNDLIKQLDTAENVKHCKGCGLGWFILNTTRPKEK